MSALLTVGATGNVPASALFASNARYKRESYRGSEFAPRVLAENGLPVVMKVCLLIVLDYQTLNWWLQQSDRRLTTELAK